MRHLRDFTGKQVVVTAQGMAYRGKVVEMTDSAVLLRSSEGYREVGMDRITAIEVDPESESTNVLPPSPLAGFGNK